MWPIALKTLVSDRGKLLTALVGVVFSIVLVNVQGGLFVGLIRKAGLLVDHGEADIWVGHKWMHNVDFPARCPAPLGRSHPHGSRRAACRAVLDRLRRHDFALAANSRA